MSTLLQINNEISQEYSQINETTSPYGCKVFNNSYIDPHINKLNNINCYDDIIREISSTTEIVRNSNIDIEELYKYIGLSIDEFKDTDYYKNTNNKLVLDKVIYVFILSMYFDCQIDEKLNQEILSILKEISDISKKIQYHYILQNNVCVIHKIYEDLIKYIGKGHMDHCTISCIIRYITLYKFINPKNIISGKEYLGKLTYNINLLCDHYINYLVTKTGNEYYNYFYNITYNFKKSEYLKRNPIDFLAAHEMGIYRKYHGDSVFIDNIPIDNNAPIDDENELIIGNNKKSIAGEDGETIGHLLYPRYRIFKMGQSNLNNIFRDDTIKQNENIEIDFHTKLLGGLINKKLETLRILKKLDQINIRKISSCYQIFRNYDIIYLHFELHGITITLQLIYYKNELYKICSTYGHVGPHNIPPTRKENEFNSILLLSRYDWLNDSDDYEDYSRYIVYYKKKNDKILDPINVEKLSWEYIQCNGLDNLVVTYGLFGEIKKLFGKKNNRSNKSSIKEKEGLINYKDDYVDLDINDDGSTTVITSNSLNNNFIIFGYKLARIGKEFCIIKLGFFEESLIIKPKNELDKCRTNLCQVIAIAKIEITRNKYIRYNFGYKNAKSYCIGGFDYVLDDIIHIDEFDTDVTKTCTDGIHFFFSQDRVIEFSGLECCGLVDRNKMDNINCAKDSLNFIQKKFYKQPKNKIIKLPNNNSDEEFDELFDDEILLDEGSDDEILLEEEFDDELFDDEILLEEEFYDELSDIQYNIDSSDESICVHVGEDSKPLKKIENSNNSFDDIPDFSKHIKNINNKAYIDMELLRNYEEIKKIRNYEEIKKIRNYYGTQNGPTEIKDDHQINYNDLISNSNSSSSLRNRKKPSNNNNEPDDY